MYIPAHTGTCILVNSDIEASLAAKLVTSFNFGVKFVCFTVSKNVVIITFITVSVSVF